MYNFRSSTSRMPQTIQLIIDSGMHKMIRDKIEAAEVANEHKKYSRSKLWDMFSPVKLSGSIQTIFIIGAAGWALSLIVFGVEIRHAAINFGFTTYKKIQLGLRKFIFVFLRRLPRMC